MTTLGAGWQPKQAVPVLPAPNPLDELLIAVTLLRDSIQNLPAPVVHVEPQDLSDVVQAVQGLAGPTSQLTAQDIASAVSEVLLGAQPSEDTPEWVERLLEALERIDFRMKSNGVVSGGGSSSVTVQNQPGTRLDVNVVEQTSGYDDNNIRTTAMGAAETWYGDWTEIDAAGSVSFLWAVLTSDGQPTTVQLEYSDDGINTNGRVTTLTSREVEAAPGVTYNVWLSIQNGSYGGRYYRGKVVQSATPGALSPFSFAGVNKFPFGGSYTYLDADLTLISQALLTRAVLAGTLPNGEFANVALTSLHSLRTAIENSPATTSGSMFTEAVRDDISISFSRDSYTQAATKIAAVTGQVGSISQNSTDGRIVFATGAGTNRVCYYESTKRSVYEPGHEILGEQTMLIPTLTGTADVRWGYMEDDGAGGILNGIGWGMDATSLYVWRTKNGADAIKVRQSSFNRDTLDGSSTSLFRRGGVPVAFQASMNTLYRVGFEWLGISPPLFRIQSPERPIIEAHTDETSNSQTGTTIPEPSLPLGVRVFSGDMAGGVTVESGSWRGGIHTSKTVLVGKQPDGDFVDAKADGTVFTTTAALGSSGTYTSAWFDSDGWRSIGLVVRTNVVSASNGILVEFTDDVEGSQTVRSSRVYTFGADDVANGFMAIRFPVELDGFRVTYMNGGTAQGSFFLGCDVRTDITELARAGLETQLVSTSSANMVRGILASRDPISSSYANITRTPTDASSRVGMHVGIMDCQVDIPIKALTTWTTGQASVSSNTTPALAISSPLSGRKTFSVKALAGNSQTVYIGPSASLNMGNGYPLAANEAVVIEVDTTAALYILGATSATQNVAFIQVA